MQIIFDGLLELGAQLTHRLPVETDDAPNAKNATDKNVVALVELDAGGIALLGQGVHGRTPTRSRNSRASSTWYRFASLPGCGVSHSRGEHYHFVIANTMAWTG